MKILIGDNGHYDFDRPILMSPEQKQGFEKMMRKLFSVVQFEESEEYRYERLGDRIFARTWTTDELRCLLDFIDLNNVCKELGRSWMSVDIKRGEFIPDFMSWAHEKGYDILKGNIKNLIEEFMEEKELKKKEINEEKKQKRSNIKSLMTQKEKLTKKRESIYRRRGILEDPKDERSLAEIEKQIIDIDEKIKLGESDIK